MATFLTWATDVLEKVDQSAANLSDSGLDRTRRKRRKEGDTLTDGHASDYSGYGSDRASSQPWPGEQLPGDPQSWNIDTLGSPPPPSLLVAPSVTMKLSGSTPQGPGSGTGQAANERPPQAWQQPIAPSSALYAARAPSLAMENLRVVRRTMEGQVWQQQELKEEYEDTLRQTSEVEAKVSITANETDKLRKAAAMAAALNEQELATLREDALAAQAAHSKEKSAHAATRIQAQMRESTLAAENIAYSKALAATQRHAEEKGVEAARLAGRIEELTREKQRLSGQLAELQMEVGQLEEQEGTSAASGPSSEAKDGETSGQQGEGAREGEEGEAAAREEGGGVCSRAQEARQRRMELASWDSQVAALEKEVETSQQNAARWPSAGQREKELERRLRGLNEQLLAKQAQAESLANEKASFQLRMDRVQEARRQLQAGGDAHDVDLKRNKIGRSSASLASAAAGRDADPDDPSGKRRPRSTARGVSEGIARVAQTMDLLSMRAGAALQRHSSARSFIVAYVLGLHLAVFVILSLAAAQKALGG